MQHFILFNSEGWTESHKYTTWFDFDVATQKGQNLQALVFFLKFIWGFMSNPEIVFQW